MSLRIGVLGASRIAELAIVGPAPAAGSPAGGRRGARSRRAPSSSPKSTAWSGFWRSYDEVIDDPEVDVVYNPLANSLHAPWNLAAIAAGKPVLTEKPFARNRSEAQQVAEPREAAGVTVMEGFHYLFHPVTRRAFDAGRRRHARRHAPRVEVRMAMPAPEDDDPRWSLEMAGGALMDLGCYGLHVMRQARPPVGHSRARQAAHSGCRRLVRCRARLPRRRDRPVRQLDGRRRPLVHPPHRRHQGRSACAQLHQAERGRPTHHPHTGGHRRRAPRHQDRRTPISWRRSPRTCTTAHRCRSTPPTRWRTWPMWMRRTGPQA